jgi:hypothetical protein
MYRVITDFYDLRDNNYHYRAGDTFPRPHSLVTNERVAELAGTRNRMGRTLIEAVESPSEAFEPTDKEIPVQKVKNADRTRRKRQGA